MSAIVSSIASRKVDSLCERMRTKPISWDGYARAGLISQADVALVQKVASSSSSSSSSSSTGKANLDADAEGPTYAVLYIKLLQSLNRNDILSYILVLLGDMISGPITGAAAANADPDDPKLEARVTARIGLFTDQVGSDCFDALLKLLNDSNDEFIRLKSATLLSIFIASSPASIESTDSSLLKGLFSGLAKIMDVGKAEEDWDLDNQAVAIQCLGAVFRHSVTRQTAWRLEKESEPKDAASRVLTP